MRIKKSNKGSVRWLGDAFYYGSDIKIFIPFGIGETKLFMEMVNSAESKAKRPLTLGEVTRIANYLENMHV